MSDAPQSGRRTTDAASSAPTSGVAIGSLALAIVAVLLVGAPLGSLLLGRWPWLGEAFVFGLLLVAVGVVLDVVAIIQTDATAGRASGRPIAVAALAINALAATLSYITYRLLFLRAPAMTGLHPGHPTPALGRSPIAAARNPVACSSSP